MVLWSRFGRRTATTNTFVGSSAAGAESDRRDVLAMQVDVLVASMERFGLQDKEGFARYVSDRILQQPVTDVGNLADVEACKNSNTRLLCEWNLSRRTAKPATEQEFSRDLLTLKAESITKIEGSVYKAHHKGKSLVIKVFDIDDQQDRRDFLYETLVHRKLCKSIPDMVPKLYRAYFLHASGKVHGVQIMERLEAITLRKFDGKVENMQQLAVHLKQSFNALDAICFWHGDLHDENILLDVSPAGNIRRVQVIDFGSSVIGTYKKNMNLLAFLNGINATFDDIACTRVRSLIPYLREVGMKIPRDILNWNDLDFDNNTLVGLRTQIVDDMKSDPDVQIDPEMKT